MSNPAGGILCPYCGRAQRGPAERCAECGGFFDAMSMRTTQQHMGPWFVRDKQAPHRPGCSYAVLLKQVQRGKIKPDTILRGPTTRQFWSLARNVPGIAHHVGYCHACEAAASPADQRCRACGVPFPEVTDRQNLGLEDIDGGAEQSAIAAVARATVVGTTSFAPEPIAASQVPRAPAPRSNVEWLTGDLPTAPGTTGSGSAPANGTDARFAAAMAAPAARITPAGEAGPPTARIESGGISPLAWVMIGLNAVVILAIAVVFILMAIKPQASNDAAKTQPAATTPGVSATASAAANAGLPAPAQSAGDAAPAPGPSAATSTPVSIAPAATPSPANSKAETSGGASFFGIEIPQDAGVPQQQIDALNQRFAEMNALYRAGNLAEALAKLKQLQQNLPPGIRAEGLDAAIQRLEKEHSDRQLRDFFNAS